MSINAIEVLEARFANRDRFIGRGELHDTELRMANTQPVRQTLREAYSFEYGPPAATGWETTPASGVPVAD